MLRHPFIAVALGAVVLMLVPLGTARAETILIDDFNDGNDDGWTQYDGLTDAGPRIVDASSGVYHLQSTGPANTHPEDNHVWSTWNASGDPVFSNGLVRVKVRSDSSGGIVGPILRVVNPSEPESGYYFLADPHWERFFIARFDARVGHDWREFYLPYPRLRFNDRQDWIIEGGCVDNLLSMKVWLDGYPEPEFPQLAILDPEPLPYGVLGVYSFINVSSDPVRIDATFDDIYFTPEATAMLRVPGTYCTVIDDDSDSVFDDQGDTFSDRSSKPAGGVGESDSESSNFMSRLIARFDLPGSTGGPIDASLLQSATLRFFLEDITNMPAGPVSVFHSVSSNSMVMSPWEDYEDGSFADTELDLVQPADARQAYYEVDVTEFVQADYAADGADPSSAFRLQINQAAFVEDNLSHRYVFTMPGAETNHPELVLTFIPEPSTIALGGLGVLGLVACRWRRKKHAA